MSVVAFHPSLLAHGKSNSFVISVEQGCAKAAHVPHSHHSRQGGTAHDNLCAAVTIWQPVQTLSMGNVNSPWWTCCVIDCIVVWSSGMAYFTEDFSLTQKQRLP